MVGNISEFCLGDKSVHADVDVFAVFADRGFGIPVIMGVDGSPGEFSQSSYSVVVDDRKFALGKFDYPVGLT